MPDRIHHRKLKRNVLILKVKFLFNSLKIASSQYPISTAVIETRAQLFGKIYQWYQDIDAAYYDLYFQVKDSIADAFSPFRTHQLDILETFELTNLTELPEHVAANFTTVIQRINQTLDMVQMYGSSYSMMSFSMYSLGDLTQLASSFKNLLSMPLSTFFNQFTMQMEPLTAECERKILSGIIPTLEPYAQAHIKLAANASKNWVDSYEFNTIEVNLAVLDVVTFADKIKICTRAFTQAARVACFTRIVRGEFLTKSLKFNFIFNTESTIRLLPELQL